MTCIAPQLSYGNTLSDLRAGNEITVVTLGTSLTRGHPTADASWVPGFEAWLKSEANDPNDVTLFNVAVSASSSSNANIGLSGVDTQLPQALFRSPDLVFIEFGFNDANLAYNISLQQSEQNLNTMIDAFIDQNAQVEIVLMTMNNPSQSVQSSTRPLINQYYDVYRDVAADRNLTIVDNYLNWKELADTNPSLWSTYVPDGIHPTQQGVEAITIPNIISALNAVPEPASMSSLMIASSLVLRRRRMAI